MNDKDKEAFKEWYMNKESEFDNCKEAWQAACEYMRNKSNPLDALSLYEKLEKERTENKKLRTLIDDLVNNGMDYDIATRLEKLEDEGT